MKKKKAQTENETDNPVVRTKTFTIKMMEMRNGNISLHRINDGFLLTELMGVIEISQRELIMTLQGQIKPDLIKRDCIID